MINIVQAPNPILREKTKPVTLPPEKIQKIIAEMKEIMVVQKDPEGVGLAANQIGLPYSMFIARYDTKLNSDIHVFINPEIITHSQELQPDEDEKAPLEGCLSLPNYYGMVKRFRWIQVKFQNEQLAMCNEQFKDFPATVIQHEMDHLNGKIFVERILEQNGRLYKTTKKPARNASHSDAGGGKDIWEEIEL